MAVVTVNLVLAVAKVLRVDLDLALVYAGAHRGRPRRIAYTSAHLRSPPPL